MVNDAKILRTSIFRAIRLPGEEGGEWQENGRGRGQGDRGQTLRVQGNLRRTVGLPAAESKGL